MEILYKEINPNHFNKRENLGFKQKIKSWFKDPYNLTFLGILLFAIAIRIYYFVLTAHQPLWWDESDYLAYAKNLANLGGDWIVTAQHNSLYPFIVAGLFLLGLGEPVIKFILAIIPSIFIVILTYLICLKMYDDKRIALISSFLMAVFWVLLFNSTRFHLEAPGFFIGLLAIYVFFQGYERKEKIFGKINPNWAIPLAVVLVVLTYAIRRGYFLFGIFILVYILTTKPWKELIKDKYNWIGLGLAVFLLFLVEKFIFFSGIGEVGGTYFHPENPLSLVSLGIFKALFSFGGVLKNISFYLFIIGILAMIVTLILHTGHLKKLRNKKSLGDLFAIITILFTLLNFIFILRLWENFGEERWYLPLALGAFIAVSRGTLLIGDYIKKYNKILAVLFIILLIGMGGYFQIKHADEIIKNKIPSFEGIKQASFYVKEISSPNDIIVSQPVPQTIYYSEMKVMQPEQIANATSSDYILGDFLTGLEKNPNAKYLFISFSEPGYPDWMKQQSPTFWKIPFMDTTIDFTTGQQNIRPSIRYQNTTFTLLDVKQDVFIYEISR